MRVYPAALVLTTAISISISAQSKNWKDDMTAALKEAYPNTKTANFERNNITQPGVILVIQKPNLMGENVHNSIYRISTVENGVGSGPKGFAGFVSSGNARELKVGEKVYVRDIDVKDDVVRLSFLSVEMYDINEKGSTKRTRLASIVDFKFPKGQLAMMSLADVRKAIDAIVVSESVASAPKSIELGQTMAQVEAVLGKPDTVINLGAKVTYVYKNMKVIFTNGKVSDVQ